MTLQEVLKSHSWRMLRAIARAHHSFFDNDWTKAQAVEQISTILSNPQTVRSALSRLPKDTSKALQTLLACEGTMPAHRFLEQFGPVRPYRPWHDDSPSAPWRDPVSASERLWFLGFIFFRLVAEGRVVTIPDELLPLLPTPSPPARGPSVEPLSSAAAPILDIAHMMTYLQSHDIKPLAGRWLTLRPLRALNAGLAYPDLSVDEARSELQTGYLRFLHYLAETSGLLDVVGGLLKPMPAAWRWLEMSESERWQTLWTSWQADLSPQPGKESLWKRYRFPAHPAFALIVLDTLRFVVPDRSLHGAVIDLPILASQVQQRCIGAGTLPRGDVLTPLQAVISGPLSWSCIVNTDSAGNVTLTSQGAWLLRSDKAVLQAPATESAAVHDDEDHLTIVLPEPPSRPPMPPLVSLGLLPKDRTTRHLTHQRFVSLLAQGFGRAGIIEALRALTGGALSREVIERLKRWEEQARELTLRRLTVLTVADTQLLARLTDQRGNRDLFPETLSPHHISVDPSQVERLLRALHRIGHTPLVEPGTISSPEPNGDPLDSGAAAHLWLALRTYLNLSDQIHLPAVPPVALLDQLEHLIDETELTELASLAERANERISDLLDGYSAFPAPLPDVDKAAIQGIIERALEDAHPVRIVYHTAGRGERTERVVEPLRLEKRGGAHYLIAYCRLRREERVFRVDRIEEAETAVGR